MSGNSCSNLKQNQTAVFVGMLPWCSLTKLLTFGVAGFFGNKRSFAKYSIMRLTTMPNAPRPWELPEIQSRLFS
jgi:hypothetical protein